MKRRAPMELVESDLLMDRIATDILGELPMTDDGNKYILVVSDYFTKWTESFPMPNMEAKTVTVAKVIVEEVKARFGVPSVITLTKVDSMRVRYLKRCARASVHKTTGYTPNYLMLGREVSTPLDIMFEMPRSVQHIPKDKWAWELKETMEIRKAGRSPTFTSYWRGPYKVLSKMTDLTYNVDRGCAGKPQVIHVDRMRRRYPQTLQGETPDDERTAPEDVPNL
ncbi:uncharacterized protein LOC134263019 [Saccostrea cucullata]|uniref:uncharacterized protein LOC134263019 n=1 Tax=Saccostrea cuccullata TaxID=36930 RepID=UPI002ED36915